MYLNTNAIICIAKGPGAYTVHTELPSPVRRPEHLHIPLGGKTDRWAVKQDILVGPGDHEVAASFEFLSNQGKWP
jgi:hypothetical protein